MAQAEPAMLVEVCNGAVSIVAYDSGEVCEAKLRERLRAILPPTEGSAEQMALLRRELFDKQTIRVDPDHWLCLCSSATHIEGSWYEYPSDEGEGTEVTTDGETGPFLVAAFHSGECLACDQLSRSSAARMYREAERGLLDGDPQLISEHEAVPPHESVVILFDAATQSEIERRPWRAKRGSATPAETE